MPPISKGAALDYIARQYGGTMRNYEEVVTVGLTTIPLLSADADRVFLALVNLGVSAVYVSPTQPVSAARGLRLGGGGGLIAFNTFQDGLMTVVPWYAVAAAAGMDVFILRVRRDTLAPAAEVEA